MKLISRIFLPLILLSSCLHAEQTLQFAKKDAVDAATTTFNTHVVKESGNLLVEHALNDYHHYYSRACDVKLFDLSLSPVYNYSRAIDGDGSFNMYGGFVQAQLNLGDFYLRANTLFGHVGQEFKDKDGKEIEFSSKTLHDDLKDTSFDDVNLKLGYDFFFNGDDHVGIYALGGIPVNREDAVAATLSGDAISFTTAPWMYKTRLGTGNYRVGAGLNAAFTLVDCDDHHLAWLSDTQYSYAFKTDVAKVSTTAYGSFDLRYTPGNTLNFFNALHYAFGCYNIEVGSIFATTFGEKWSIEKAEGNKYPEAGYTDGNGLFTNSLKALDANSMTVSFKAQPYLAFSYNTTVCDCPLMLGLGAGYEYNKLHSEACSTVAYNEPGYTEYQACVSRTTPNAFQGVTAWGTVAVSF